MRVVRIEPAYLEKFYTAELRPVGIEIYKEKRHDWVVKSVHDSIGSEIIFQMS
jgi:hypothetical protein